MGGEDNTSGGLRDGRRGGWWVTITLDCLLEPDVPICGWYTHCTYHTKLCRQNNYC